jgi:hypothetical protein
LSKWFGLSKVPFGGMINEEVGIEELWFSFALSNVMAVNEIDFLNYFIHSKN